MTNHGCRFTWCENDSNSCDAQRFEHYQGAQYVPVTGDSLFRFGYTDRKLDEEQLPIIGVGVRFNEDLDPAPNVFFHIAGGPRQETELEFRIDEAVLLYNTLGNAIAKAVTGSNLSPARITKLYSIGGDR